MFGPDARQHREVQEYVVETGRDEIVVRQLDVRVVIPRLVEKDVHTGPPQAGVEGHECPAKRSRSHATCFPTQGEATVKITAGFVPAKALFRDAVFAKRF